MKVIVIEKGLARKMPNKLSEVGDNSLPTYPCPIEWPVGSEWKEGKDFKLQSDFRTDINPVAPWIDVIVPIEKEEDEWKEFADALFQLTGFSLESRPISFVELKQSFTIKRKV